MAATITYLVADHTASIFVVTTQRPLDTPLPPPPDPVCVVRWRADVGTPGSTPGEPRDGGQDHAWSLDDRPAARHHVVVSLSAPVESLPRPVQAARAHAHQVAQATAGTRHDWATGLALPAQRPERDTFRLGDDWLLFALKPAPGGAPEVPGQRPLWEQEPPGTAGAPQVTTARLARFGLPELVVDGVGPGRELTTVNVARAVAHHLLLDHWKWLRATGCGRKTRREKDLPGRVRRLSARQTIPGVALAGFWNTTVAATEPFEVRLAEQSALLRVRRRGWPRRPGWGRST